MEGKNLGLKFGGVKGGDIHMSAYVDADHAACTDSQRSVSGVAVRMAYAVISYILRTQKIRALATSESKYVGLAERVK